MMLGSKLPIVVLISGSGTNVQAIINAIGQGLQIEVRAVISNQPQAYGIERAKQANIPTHVIPHHLFSGRNAFEERLVEQIDAYQPQLIVLAGFMRKLSAQFVHHYSGKIVNIHPSLLPNYPGLTTHRKALNAGDKFHGATIHFVTEAVDQGPIICQAKLEILPGDDEISLQRRVLNIEHYLYPKVLSWFAEKRIYLSPSGIMFDNELLPFQGVCIIIPNSVLWSGAFHGQI